jgi:tellurite resistance protein
MDEITYELIQPLILSEEVNGSKMTCQFEVPGTGEVIEASASIKRDKGLKSQIQKRVTRTVTSRARVSASRMVRGILGGGMLGRIGSQVVNTASRDLTQDLTRGFTSTEKQMAVVQAFNSVAKHFKYDDVLGWKKNSEVVEEKSKKQVQKTTPEKKQVSNSASDFERLVARNPVSNNFEKDVLARMLVEVAKADGGISNDEEEFLKEFIPNYDQITSKPLLNPIECEEVGRNSKMTIFTTAWVIALVDLEINPLEIAKLDQFADWFGLSDKNYDEAVRMAKSYILEQSLSPSSSNEDAITAGKLLELSDEDSLRIFIRYKKRM